MPSEKTKVPIDVKALNGYLVFVQDASDKAQEIIELLTISNKIKDFLLVYIQLVKSNVFNAQTLLLP